MRVLRWIAGLLLALLLAACGGGASDGAGTPDPAPRGEVVVFAAASLTEAFEQIGERFTQANPGLTVTYNFAGSQQLAGQIVEGAPADVFASANQRQMDVVGEAGLIAGESRPFASNLLAIAVEPGNPLGIGGLADLATPDLVLVLAAEEVPAGRYAQEALDAAGVEVSPASREPDVRAVLSRVALGEADAGIVYASDVAAAGGEVEGVPIPADDNVRATYPVAALADAPNPEGARAFADFVRSADAQGILADHGFAPAEDA